MTCPLTQLVHSQNSRLSRQIQTLQEDLQNLSRITSHLSNLTDEEIQAFDFSGQLETIHQCLRRFEARLLSINLTAYEYEFAAVESSEPATDPFPVQQVGRRSTRMPGLQKSWWAGWIRSSTKSALVSWNSRQPRPCLRIQPDGYTHHVKPKFSARPNGKTNSQNQATPPGDRPSAWFVAHALHPAGDFYRIGSA